MQINQIIVLDIVDMTDEGYAVGKMNNLTIFLDKGVVGDTVQAKIEKIKKNYIVAKIVDILKKSDIREEKMICDIQNLCGGCQILHIKYPYQLKIKQNLLKQKLERIGNISNPNIKDIIEMEKPFRYRNKTQMPIGIENGDLKVGFYKQKTHDIIPFTDCKIQNKINNSIIQIVKDFVKKENISIYDEKNNTGNLRHIITKISQKKNEIMLILVTKDDKRLYVDYLVDKFNEHNIKVSSIIQNINEKKTNVIMSNKNILLFGKEYIEDVIHNLIFRIYPNSFYQVNSIQMEKMYDKALEYADLKGNETVYDLYCGIGTISLLLARKSEQVYAIEVVKEAVYSANENAKINNIDNVQFISGKVEDEIENLLKKSKKPDVIMLDPARKGCEEKVLNTILMVKPKRIVYISCNPSTLARDLKILLKDGEYKLEELTPYDLFCHTMHCEVVVLMSRVG